MGTSNPKVTFKQKGSHLPLTTHNSSFHLSSYCIYHFLPCVRVICAGSDLSVYKVSSLQKLLFIFGFSTKTCTKKAINKELVAGGGMGGGTRICT